MRTLLPSSLLLSSLLLSSFLLSSCNTVETADTFQQSLQKFVDTTKAHIAVSIDYMPPNSTEAVHYGVHESDSMITMSAIKFGIAVSALHASENGEVDLNGLVRVDSADMVRDTWSPWRESQKGLIPISLREAISYSVSHSDNIATDVVIDALKGPVNTQKFLTEKGLTCMNIGSTYRDMTPTTLHLNWSTSQCMNRLLMMFDRDRILNADNTKWLYSEMLNSPTTAKRLRGRLPEGTPVAHKTGTFISDETPNLQGAVNDVGIITLPSGGKIYISVFVNDAHYTYEQTEAIIAEIAQMAYDKFYTTLLK